MGEVNSANRGSSPHEKAWNDYQASHRFNKSIGLSTESDFFSESFAKSKDPNWEKNNARVDKAARNAGETWEFNNFLQKKYPKKSDYMLEAAITERDAIIKEEKEASSFKGDPPQTQLAQIENNKAQLSTGEEKLDAGTTEPPPGQVKIVFQNPSNPKMDSYTVVSYHDYIHGDQFKDHGSKEDRKFMIKHMATGQTPRIIYRTPPQSLDNKKQAS